ncbi:MAG TPA: excalibur calcium-binding domain-containing protein [Gammaproteobacteria bacterium]|nr:excalibur calcium-binding domain-containing protein [Gammaproteobacteria bacterium]
MKKIILILIIFGAWHVNKNGWPEFIQKFNTPVITTNSVPKPFQPNILAPAPTSQFSCDGRTHCSQMRSCAEATYFLRNCPNTKMDGDGNGVPCERQWCR